MAHGSGPSGLRQDLLLGVIVAAAVALRLTGLERDIWVDEYSSIQVAMAPEPWMALRNYDHPPLYFLLLRGWSWLGTSDVMLRLLSVILGVATLVTLISWVRTYASVPAWIAGILAASLPILVRYSQEIRDYGLLLLLVALAFSQARRLIVSPTPWGPYIGIAICLSLATATHLIGVFAILSVATYAVLQEGVWRRISWSKGLVALALPFLTFGLFYLFFQSHLAQRDTSNWWMPPSGPAVWRDAISSLLGIPPLYWIPVAKGDGLTAQAARQLTATLQAIPYLLAGLLVMPGNWRRSLPLLAAVLAYLIPVAIYSRIFVPIVIDRTLLPALLPLLAFAAVRWSDLRWATARRLATVAVIVLSLTWATVWVRSISRASIEPWRSVALMVEKARRPNSPLLHYGWVEGILAHYLKQPVPKSASVHLHSRDSIEHSLQNVEAAIAASQPGDPVVLVARMFLWRPGERVWFDLLGARLAQRLGDPTESYQLGILLVRVYQPGNTPGPEARLAPAAKADQMAIDARQG